MKIIQSLETRQISQYLHLDNLLNSAAGRQEVWRDQNAVTLPRDTEVKRQSVVDGDSLSA